MYPTVGGPVIVPHDVEPSVKRGGAAMREGLPAALRTWRSKPLARQGAAVYALTPSQAPMGDSDVARFLEERPELEPAVAAALRVEMRSSQWGFEDIETDSGAFGELVAAGIVERDGESYRLADPYAARAALDEETTDTEQPSLLSSRLGGIDPWPFSTDLTVMLAVALSAVVLMRITAFRSVFRAGNVVLPANDPWFYRYWVDQVAAAAGPLDPSGLAAVPPGVIDGEPLLVATLWLYTALLGGGSMASGLVLAWYPVVSACLVAFLTFQFTRMLTDDPRIAVLSVVILAVVPAHVVRTSLGFADHHAFDYIWLMLTATGAMAIVRDVPDSLIPGQWSRLTWLGVVGVGTGVAGQVLAWEAGPLLVLPLVVFVPLSATLAVRDGGSPLRLLAPLMGGVGIAAIVTGIFHLVFAWQDQAVALVPTVLFGGSVVVVLAAETVRRRPLPISRARAAIAVQLLSGLLAFSIAYLLVPGLGETLSGRLGTLFAERQITEVQSLFALGQNPRISVVGPPLIVAMAGAVWATLSGWIGDQGHLLGVSYFWTFLLLAAIQLRFAGELSMFIAAFAGLGIVYLLSRLGCGQPPAQMAETTTPDLSIGRPSLRTAAILVLVLGTMTGYGATESLSETSTSAVSDGSYRTASFAAQHAAVQEREYPESYVLSRWGRNRMYNYLVNGESRSYGFAQRTYVGFMSSVSPESDGWGDRFAGRVGYIVVDPTVTADGPFVYTRLNAHYGSRDGAIGGLAHYRLLYETDTPDGPYQLFEVVPGATLTGSLDASDPMLVSTAVRVDQTAFDYQRRVVPSETGQINVTVAYPGVYEIAGRNVTVSEAAVTEGRTINIE